MISELNQSNTFHNYLFTKSTISITPTSSCSIFTSTACQTVENFSMRTNDANQYETNQVLKEDWPSDVFQTGTNRLFCLILVSNLRCSKFSHRRVKTKHSHEGNLFESKKKERKFRERNFNLHKIRRGETRFKLFSSWLPINFVGSFTPH